MKMEASMHTIAVIACYIGRFPEWFQLWLNSCGHNDTIDFFLYTDQDKSAYQVPNNVFWRNTSLPVLQKQISNICGFQVSLEKAYKLCDYRPLYGLIFTEDVRNYDFWGCCDIDMVFGDLRNFITEEILESYDRIFEVGHLSLYRNCREMNEAYRLPGGMMTFEEIARTKPYCGFDEHTGITRILQKNGFKTYAKVVCADIDPHYRAFYMMDEDSVQAEGTVENFEHQIFYIDGGKTFKAYIDPVDDVVKQSEVSYIHFMRKYPKDAKSCNHMVKFAITHKQFIPLSVWGG